MSFASKSLSILFRSLQTSTSTRFVCGHRPVVPEALDEIALGKCAALIAHQQFQQCELARRHLDAFSIATDGAIDQIEHNAARFDALIFTRGLRPPQECLHASEEFGKVEGL